MSKEIHDLDRLLSSSNAELEAILSYSSKAKEDIRDLQQLLFETGYEDHLNWERHGADGHYGRSTIAAVKTFASNNGIESDGRSVSKAILRALLAAHEALENLYLLYEDVQAKQVKARYRKGGERTSIAALQFLLNDLGFGVELSFDRYGADGVFGKSTIAAVTAFAKKHELPYDGGALTLELASAIVEQFHPRFGKDWMAMSKNMAATDGRRALVLFSAANFVGKVVHADHQFVPLLERINKYAKAAEVLVYVTSSFRTSTKVQGAIVKPATRSNHMVGHAIDMNLQYGARRMWANSAVLAKYPKVPEPVKEFLGAIIADADLRWGGSFAVTDPVHIDDGLNVRSPSTWDRRYQLLQRTAQETSDRSARTSISAGV